MDKHDFIFNTLDKKIKKPTTELNYETPFQLLIAVILSAQCTDKRVNQITPVLFKKYGTPQKLSQADNPIIEEIIYSCGFFKNKAKNIISASKTIMEKYNGVLPDTLEGLTSLAGVGRKSANVILATIFKGNTIAVDTHVKRVANRLELASTNNVYQIEKQLQQKFEEKHWSKLHHLLVLFGRYYCTARNPRCDICEFKEICSYYKQKK